MQTAVATIVCMIILLAFVAFFSYAFHLVKGFDYLRLLNHKEVILLCLIALSLTCFAGLEISRNRFVYFWDYGGFWTRSYSLMDTMFNSPRQGLSDVLSSINTDDYNLLLPLLLCLPLKLFGYSFKRYVVINCILFLLPALLIQSVCCMRILESIEVPASGRHLLSSFLMVALFPMPYFALLLGFIDVAGLIPISLLIMLLILWQPCAIRKETIKQDVTIGLLLLTLVLFRRYFFYFAVGFVVALIVKAIILCISGRHEMETKEAVRNIFLNLLTSALPALCIALLLFRPFLVHALTTNYAAQYAAYDLPLPRKLNAILCDFGYITLLFIVVDGLAAIRERRLRTPLLLLVVLLAVPVILFFRVQAMGYQHLLIICVPVFLLNYLCLAWLHKLGRSNTAGISRPAAGIMTVLYLFCFLQSYVPATRTVLHYVQPLFSQTYDPLERDDISSLEALANHVNQLTGDSSKTVYVIASGPILNDDILRSLGKPETSDAVTNLTSASHIDLRDGFPAEFLTADTVITTSPTQLHEAEGTQEVVRFLAQEIQDQSSPIGRHFHRESSFALDSEVTAIVYVKDSEFDRTDLQYLSDYYSSRYPGQETIFSDRILQGALPQSDTLAKP